MRLLALIAMAAVISGCQQPSNSIQFSPTFNGEPVSCHSELLINGESWRLSQLQFYLHQLQVKNRQGDWLDADIKLPAEQHQQVAMLGANCPQTGNWQLHWQSELAAQEITAIRFKLGVPFALNHLNPLTQAFPLNQADMFWTWRTGYKFARIEMVTAAQQPQQWVFHLGSTGCQSAAPVRAPQKACANPNLAEIVLTPFKPDQPVQIDLSALTQALEPLADNSCQSDPNSVACQSILPRFGLGGTQRVFKQ